MVDKVDCSATPDDVLVTAAHSNPHIFAILYDRYFDRIYRYCYVRLGNREAAEDATSEVFMKALANLERAADGCFAAWLFRIAHNVVVDAYRRQRPVASLEEAVDPADPGPTPEESTVARTTRDSLTQVLRDALGALSDDQRAVIELRLAEWSIDQIATTLGKSPASVKMLHLRALNRLRILFDGYDHLDRLEGHNG